MHRVFVFVSLCTVVTGSLACGGQSPTEPQFPDVSGGYTGTQRVVSTSPTGTCVSRALTASPWTTPVELALFQNESTLGGVAQWDDLGFECDLRGSASEGGRVALLQLNCLRPCADLDLTAEAGQPCRARICTAVFDFRGRAEAGGALVGEWTGAWLVQRPAQTESETLELAGTASFEPISLP